MCLKKDVFNVFYFNLQSPLSPHLKTEPLSTVQTGKQLRKQAIFFKLVAPEMTMMVEKLFQTKMRLKFLTF